MRITTAALFAGLVSATALSAQDQIVNGDFETGDLTGAGAPGCFLGNDGLVVLSTAVTPPTSIALLPLPNNPALAGVVLEAQGFALAAGINALGLITSNGLSLTIGDV
ncbi:MAG: hypothetical protein AAF196_08585 [Planctomycetota bacterium]